MTDFNFSKWYELEFSDKLWSPISVRRNDITSLVNSKFGGLLEELIADLKVKFKWQCDSAYINSKVKVSGGGRGMASVRDVITTEVLNNWNAVTTKRD